jgi:hypothetical protein
MQSPEPNLAPPVLGPSYEPLEDDKGYHSMSPISPAYHPTESSYQPNSPAYHPTESSYQPTSPTEPPPVDDGGYNPDQPSYQTNPIPSEPQFFARRTPPRPRTPPPPPPTHHNVYQQQQRYHQPRNDYGRQNDVYGSVPSRPPDNGTYGSGYTPYGGGSQYGQQQRPSDHFAPRGGGSQFGGGGQQRGGRRNNPSRIGDLQNTLADVSKMIPEAIWHEHDLHPPIRIGNEHAYFERFHAKGGK